MSAISGREKNAFGCETVEVRRVVTSPAIAVEVPNAEVVRENENDVGIPGDLSGWRCSCGGHEAKTGADDKL